MKSYDQLTLEQKRQAVKLCRERKFRQLMAFARRSDTVAWRSLTEADRQEKMQIMQRIAGEVAIVTAEESWYQEENDNVVRSKSLQLVRSA